MSKGPAMFCEVTGNGIAREGINPWRDCPELAPSHTVLTTYGYGETLHDAHNDAMAKMQSMYDAARNMLVTSERYAQLLQYEAEAGV